MAPPPPPPAAAPLPQLTPPISASLVQGKVAAAVSAAGQYDAAATKAMIDGAIADNPVRWPAAALLPAGWTAPGLAPALLPACGTARATHDAPAPAAMHQPSCVLLPQTNTFQNQVIVFSWSGCPFCKRAKALLDSTGAKYKALELDQMPEGGLLRALGGCCLRVSATLLGLPIAGAGSGGDCTRAGLHAPQRGCAQACNSQSVLLPGRFQVRPSVPSSRR